MKIDEIIITIRNVDEESASVQFTTNPPVDNPDDIEDNPASDLGANIWTYIQYLHQAHDTITEAPETIQ